MTYVACVIVITVAAFIKSYVCSTSCNVFVLTWLLFASDQLLDKFSPPGRMTGQHPGPAQTLWTYTLALWGILSVAAPHSCFALLASVRSDIDHYIVDLALGTSRDFTIKGLVQVYRCTQLPNAL